MRTVDVTHIIVLASVCALLAGSVPAKAQEPEPATAASDSAAVVAAAESWLTLLDQGDFTAAYDEAAPLLQQMAGSAAGWSRFVGMARANFPAAPERSIMAYTAEPDVTGAPSGEYRSVTFATGPGGGISERAVLVRLDGVWKVAMYGTRGGPSRFPGNADPTWSVQSD